MPDQLGGPWDLSTCLVHVSVVYGDLGTTTWMSSSPRARFAHSREKGENRVFPVEVGGGGGYMFSFRGSSCV